MFCMDDMVSEKHVFRMIDISSFFVDTYFYSLYNFFGGTFNDIFAKRNKTCYNDTGKYKSFLNENRVKKLVSQKSQGVFGSFFV